MARKRPYKPCEEELQEGATDVSHDVRMLAKAFDHCSGAFAYTAWFVHCRAVMGFVDCNGQPEKDDIFACHYLERWKGIRAKLEKPQRYDEYWKATNKLAAHLTYSRAVYRARPLDQQVTPSGEITDHLLGVIDVFVGELPNKRRAWFGDPVDSSSSSTGSRS